MIPHCANGTFFSQVLEFGFEFVVVSPSNSQNMSTITPSVIIDGTSGAIMSEPADRPAERQDGVDFMSGMFRSADSQ